MQALVVASQKGTKPLIACCDFNATSDEIRTSGWLGLLGASFINSDECTSISRVIDFAVVSNCWLRAKVFAGASRSDPSKTHALFSLCLSKQKQIILHGYPRAPERCLPCPLGGTVRAEALWESLSSSASLHPRTRDILAKLPTPCWTPSGSAAPGHATCYQDLGTALPGR